MHVYSEMNTAKWLVNPLNISHSSPVCVCVENIQDLLS